MADPCSEPLPAAIRRGIAEFNRREFYRAHDTIEAHWRAEKRGIRTFYQGILQVSVAFYHLLERKSLKSFRTMIARGTAKLAPFAPRCQGVDIKGLLSQVDRAEAEAEKLGSAGLALFDGNLLPVIRVDGEDP